MHEPVHRVLKRELSLTDSSSTGVIFGAPFGAPCIAGYYMPLG